jgi:hypothetical protein
VKFDDTLDYGESDSEAIGAAIGVCATGEHIKDLAGILSADSGAVVANIELRELSYPALNEPFESDLDLNILSVTVLDGVRNEIQEHSA